MPRSVPPWVTGEAEPALADDPQERNRRARSFRAVAERYEQRRPSYPDAAFDDLVAGDDVTRAASRSGRARARPRVALACRGLQVTAL